MARTPLTPPVADYAPDAGTLTDYDRDHLITYLRLLDAEADGADWAEAARLVLSLDPQGEPEKSRAVWTSHLGRAHWMRDSGYEHLLREGQDGNS